MDCEAVRDVLLIADLVELEQGRDGALADHLRSCPDCSAMALAIVSATRGLALDLTPATPLALQHPRTLRNRPRLVRPAIAAGIIGAMLLGLRAFEHRSTPVDPVAAHGSETRLPAVTVPRGQNAMVFRTSNPRITVVWYY
jgi:hypothetical protein